MHHSDVHRIRNYLEARLNEHLTLLREMVAINSYTGNAAGVDRLGRMTAAAFEPLGFEAEHVPTPTSGWGSHLFMERPGRSELTIGLVSHLDTVYPEVEEREHGFVRREEGERIYGPGVGDIKGGTVLMHMVLEAMGEFFPDETDDIRWVLALNAAEERLDPHFNEVLQDRLGHTVLAALVFEGTPPTDDDSWSVVAARKGRADFRVTVTGKGAHAGADFQRGVNAVVHAAHIIPEVAAISDAERQLSVNVACVQGGNVTNRVPHVARFEGEMRAFEPEVLAEAVHALQAICQKAGSQSSHSNVFCDAEITASLAAWPHNPGTAGLIELWRRTGEVLGMRIEGVERGGLSDGNLLCGRYPTLDGLGPSGTNYHCSEHDPEHGKEAEYILPSTLVPRALLHTLAISELVRDAEKA